MTAREERLSQPYAVPPDVKVVAVTDLAPHVREALDDGSGGFVVVRPGYRTHSRLVDADTVALLDEFRDPTPIGEGVARFAIERGLEPTTVLRDAFPVLQMLTGSYLLVPADSVLMDGVAASFAPGELAFGYEVLRIVQVLADSEVYAARTGAGEAVALKVGRPGAPGVGEMLHREAEILRRLGGEAAPRLVEFHGGGDQPILVTAWIFGVPASARSQEVRAGGRPGWRRHLHRMAVSIVEAYAGLHAAGVVHGDVHAGNVLLASDDRPWLLDFGLARIPGAPPPLDHLRRAGFSWHTEPEAAAAAAAAAWPPPPSFAGEQYSVASLVYTFVCGGHHAGESLDRAEAMQRVVEHPPLPFTRHGFEAWPAVEGVLRRALAKRPEDRFPGMAALRHALVDAAPPQATAAGSRRRPAHEGLVEAVLARLEGAGVEDAFPQPPLASVQYGAAGLALFLHRLAVAREDGDLAAEADRWSLLAQGAAAGAGGFDAPDVGVTDDRVGPDSLYHRAPGVHLVRFNVAHGVGDLASAQVAAASFQELLGGRGDDPELAFGTAGLLVGGALVMEVLRSTSRFEPAPFGEALAGAADQAWAAATAEMEAVVAARHLGAAHGLAGIVYAQLMVRTPGGLPEPDGLRAALDRLGELAEPAGRGVSWPGTRHHAPGTGTTPDHAPGWCAGTAGHVHLWLAAHEAWGDERYAVLAERAGWHAWEHPGRHGHLCCGLAGRGYALVRLYRHTGDPAWLERARDLAERSLTWAAEELDRGTRPLGLWWGALGPLLLNVELGTPEQAAMPLFAPEGWPAA